MREFLIQERKKAKLVRSAPGLSDEAPPAPPAKSLAPLSGTTVRRPAARAFAPAATSAPRARARRGQRQFVVSYDGALVGFFEAQTEITPREAFRRVAADLGATDDAFDPEKLEIYKPVLLRGARPPNGLGRVKGKLTRVPPKQK